MNSTAVLETIIVLVLLAVPVTADTLYGDFIGESAVVFDDTAHVYESPDEAAVKVCRLPQGSEVVILQQTDTEHISNGLASFWIGIGFDEVDGISQGYIPGSSLALTAIDLGGDTLFAFGVTGYDEQNYCFSGCARVTSSGRTLAQAPYSPCDGGFGNFHCTYSVSCESRDPAGLTDAVDMIVVDFEYEACGFPNCEVPFIWTGNDLVAGPEAISQFEAGYYHYLTEIITPSHTEGIQDSIVLRSVIEIWDEAQGGYVVDGSESRTFQWTGTGFTELPVQ